MAPIPKPPAEPQDQPDSCLLYMCIRDRGWTTVRSLPPGAIITMEYLSGRLNFEVRDGVVTRAWKG